MKPVVLCVLDGWGFSKQKLSNAVENANTPNLDFIKENYPSILLETSGLSTGLSWGESGNSEVGHLTLGSGRIIPQYSTIIDKAIDNDSFFTNPQLMKAIQHCKDNKSRIHLIGLLTSNTVHAYINHLFALIELAKKNNITEIYLHLFTDGKDSAQKEAPFIYTNIDKFMKSAGIGKLATVVGRDIAMDRNNNWDLTQLTYNLITKAQGEKSADIYKSLEEKYAQGLTDIVIPPLVIDESGIVKDGDSIIFFNYREDRMKQLAEAFVDPDFNRFEKVSYKNLYIVSMTKYLENVEMNYAFSPISIKKCLAEAISEAGLKQAHIAETEKYAHVTFFFNALQQHPFKGEDDILIKSDRDATANPAMKAKEITDEVIKNIDKDEYAFMLVNYANPDMLAHMGNYENTVKGIEFLDTQIAKLKDAVLAKQGHLIITSDHGNAEAMTYKGTGTPETMHNPNPVSIFFISEESKRLRTGQEIEYSTGQSQGFLSDVAPTILELLNIPKPIEMTGDSLLKYFK